MTGRIEMSSVVNMNKGRHVRVDATLEEVCCQHEEGQGPRRSFQLRRFGTRKRLSGEHWEYLADMPKPAAP